MNRDQPARILITSDRPAWCELAVQAVKRLGHHPIQAGSGDECLQIIRDQPPELILLDWSLGDGIPEEFWGRLQAAIQEDEPFLILVFEPEKFQEVLQVEPDGYLYQPLTEQELTALLVTFIRQKRSRDIRRANQARLRSIFRAAPVGIGLVSNRTLLEVNDRLVEMTGYSREELIGKNARILYPSEEEYQFVGKEKYQEIRQQGTGSVETRFLRKDGEIIHVLLSSTPLEVDDLEAGVTFSALDITERVKVLEELRKTNLLLDKSQEIAHVGSWDLNPASGDLIWSDEVFRIFGLEPQEFKPTYDKFLEFVHPDDREKVDEVYSMSLESGKEGYELEHRIIRGGDDQIRYVHEICDHIRNQAGTVVRSLGMVQDITERIRVMEELQEHRGHLEEEVRVRTARLRKLVNAMAGREVRMADLKKINRTLRTQLEEAGINPEVPEVEEDNGLGEGG